MPKPTRTPRKQKPDTDYRRLCPDSADTGVGAYRYVATRITMRRTPLPAGHAVEQFDQRVARVVQ